MAHAHGTLLREEARLLQGLALDVYTRNGAEWLRLREVRDAEHMLRLDEIARMREREV
jgi:transcriptional antiterminator Rof (Rho-off)